MRVRTRVQGLGVGGALEFGVQHVLPWAQGFRGLELGMSVTKHNHYLE